MQKDNVIQAKSYDFALRIVLFVKNLQKDQKEFVLTKQLLRSGTSIGANIEEALQGQSRKDFIAKLSISLKENHETRFWLRLLKDSQIAPEIDIDDLLQELEEIKRILTAIIKTSKLTP